MSDTEAKLKHSKRLHKDSAAMEKQAKIAKQHGIEADSSHRYSKHHAMDCGNPECPLCSNPRRIYGEKTIQERRMFQDIIE